MKSINLTALAFAVALTGAASVSAGEVSSVAMSTTAHGQAWNLTKLRTHRVKHHHKRAKVYVRPSYKVRVRAHIRKRYWGSWSQTSDRFEGFPFRGDGFRASGQYQ